MANTANIVGNNSHLDLAEISQLLESSNLSVIDETVELVRDTLGSQTEPWLLSFLVDFYIQTGNTHARDLLCMIRQHQHKALMNKIDEHLQKVSTRLKSLSLLNHIIRNEPTWTHHILASRAFQSVLKCLQVDTDLPTITSALYALATIMPKVASQLSNHLSTICGIYVRLVSWHSIKPVGASEANLIHVHAAVYALFLCLYGMYPCYFMKYLQQYFHIGSPSSKGVLTDKEKMRVFENSVSPMLDQVRLHPGLITDSTSVEVQSVRWRKLESQDIIANISKVSLDITENSGVAYGGAERKLSTVSDMNDASVQMLSSVCSKMSTKTSRAGSDAETTMLAPEQSQESIWSPSIAIGLSTPPLSRAMSPAPAAAMLDASQIAAKFDSLQKSESDPDIEDSNSTTGRPSTLNMSIVDAFVPNRPHQTASAASTPLKHLMPSFLFSSSQSHSNSQNSSPQSDMKRKSVDEKLEQVFMKEDCNSTVAFSEHQQSEHSSTPAKKEDCESPDALSSRKSSCVSLPRDEPFVSISSKDIASPPPLSPGVFTDFSPGLLPNPENPVPTMKRLEKQGDFNEPVLPVGKLLNLKSRSKYIEKTPNELLDMHISLVAEAYDKYRDKFPVTSGKDVEWQIGDGSGICGQPSAEVMYLRSQVLQMHCAMLYERHRREQHALRARKLMRKLYDTTAMEEKIKTLNSQLSMKKTEIKDCQDTVKLCHSKLQTQEENHTTQLENLKSELETMKSNNEELILKNAKLEKEKAAIVEECEAMRTEVAKLDANVFKLEHKLKISQTNNELISKMESKIRELQARLLDARETNSLLESQVQDARGACRAQSVESKIIIDTHAKELEIVKAKCMKDRKALDLTQLSLEQVEASLQKEKSIVTEQKKYLENVKSLARGQIKAMESKYNAQKHICQRLEIQVMELFSRLSAIEGEMAVQERTHLTSGPRAIQTLSALQSDSQYQHIYSSSPQLSPPMHGSLLAERAPSHSQGAKTPSATVVSENSQPNPGT